MPILLPEYNLKIYKNMKAAFLIRCSTKKQDYERQVKDLTRLAKRFGYEYGDSTIYGEHITGKDDATKRDRLSIQHLKEGAEEKKFDVVLVSEVSRMSRDPMSGRMYIRQLINMEIPVYFRDIDTWTIDPQTGRKTRDAETIIGAAFDAAWKYLKSMKTQIASGRRDELDNNCMSIGQPFFGYKRFGGRDKTKKNRWVVDEAAAEVVVDVFNEYLKDGATLKSTSLAITAKYGEKFNRKFSVGTIEHILTYESFYTGINKITLTDPDTEENVLSEGETVPVTVTYTVTQDDIDTGKLVRKTEASAETADRDEVEDEQTSEVILRGTASIDFSKKAAVQQISDARAGAAIQYYFTVTNSGNLTLRNIEVIDQMEGLSRIEYDWEESTDSRTGEGYLSPGERVTAYATYEITSDDIQRGKIVNKAFARGETLQGKTIESNEPEAPTSISQEGKEGKRSGSPETGDETDLFIYLFPAIVSFAVLVTSFVLGEIQRRKMAFDDEEIN